MSKCLLHLSKLLDFKQWCASKNIETRDGRGQFQVLQVKCNGKYEGIYKRSLAQEHLTVPPKLLKLVRQFIADTKRIEPPLPVEVIYSRSDDDWRNQSLEEVLELLEDDHQLQVGMVIFSCEPNRPSHGHFFSASSVIEAAQENALSEHGEHAESYLRDISEEATALLQTMLEGWAERNAADPTFYHCSNIQPVTITLEMIEAFRHGKYFELCSKACSCCQICSQHPCDCVQAGGLCDATHCTCDDHDTGLGFEDDVSPLEAPTKRPLLYEGR